MKPPIHQIRDYVKQIKDAFPNAEVKYGFDIEDDTHAIFVMPQEVFESDKLFDIEIEINSDYFSKYRIVDNLYFPSQEYILNELNSVLYDIDLLDPTQFEKAEKYHRERAERELNDLKQQIEMLEKQLEYK